MFINGDRKSFATCEPYRTGKPIFISIVKANGRSMGSI